MTSKRIPERLRQVERQAQAQATPAALPWAIVTEDQENCGWWLEPSQEDGRPERQFITVDVLAQLYVTHQVIEVSYGDQSTKALDPV